MKCVEQMSDCGFIKTNSATRRVKYSLSYEYLIWLIYKHRIHYVTVAVAL
jgi:hypothetical protein